MPGTTHAGVTYSREDGELVGDLSLKNSAEGWYQGKGEDGTKEAGEFLG